MNRLSNRLLLVTTLATLTFSAGTGADVIANEEASLASLDGLQLVEKDSRGEIYANPDVDWSVYTEIQLLDATVAFRRNWKRDQNRYDPFKVKTADVERIKQQLSEQFREVFSVQLTKDGGYTLAEAAGPSVLTIEPAIVDLDIAAPDTMQAYNSKAFTDSSGRMTLKLELYDSVTGELLATASDRRQSPYRGYMQWTTSVSNRADAQRMLQQWAEGLRKRLDEARAAHSPAAE